MSRKKPIYTGCNPADYRMPVEQIAACGTAAGALLVADSARAASVRAAHKQPPTVPPLNNMGGKSAGYGQTGLDPSISAAALPHDYQEPWKHTVMLMTSDGPKELTLRAGFGNDLAHVDAVSFTFHEETILRLSRNETLLCGEDFARVISRKLSAIMGFGITAKREKGLNYYQESWLLGEKYGVVSFGGQRNTMLVQITGTGCAAASDGWEYRLYRFLQDEAVRPRITRVDLAYDDLQGDYTVDLAHAENLEGRYSAGGRHPYLERRGDWDRPDGSGRTLYVGKRTNGKYARIYEKGKEQGDKNHPWVRVEVELKSVDRIIPFEVLIESGAYFAGCYPAFERFRGIKTPQRIKTQQEQVSVTYDHLLHYASLQVGRFINFMTDVAKHTPDQIISLLRRPDGSLPDRLALSSIHCDFIPEDRYLHNADSVTVDWYALKDSCTPPAVAFN